MLKAIIMITVTSLVIVTICYEVTLAEVQDEIGIYFDQAGLTSSYKTTQLGEYVEAWLILKNMSSESGIQGIIVYGLVEGEAVNFCWGSLIGEQPAICYPDWMLPANPPLPQTDILVAVEIWFLVPSPLSVIELFVKPYPAPPYEGETAYYMANDGMPGTLIPLYPSSGSYDLPVAAVNAEIVTYEGVTWGSVKALYQ